MEVRRPVRQDTFDLRGGEHDMMDVMDDEGEHSVLEDDSDEGELHDDGEYLDDEDDGSSSLSIPNESIDFDLVYSLHSFAATVEGQANVVKGDSLILMDDSNSYWWLVRVLKTQEVGYIPAENIETPFERLARLNKHRNVDLASATQAEQQQSDAQDRLRAQSRSRQGKSPSPLPPGTGNEEASNGNRGVAFTPARYVHRYPPAVWHDDEEEEEDVEWDDEPYEDEDEGLAEEKRLSEAHAAAAGVGVGAGVGRMNVDVPQAPGQGQGRGQPMNVEPDDGMAWDENAVRRQQEQQQWQANGGLPGSVRPPAQQQQQQQQAQTQDSYFQQQQQPQQIQPLAVAQQPEPRPINTTFPSADSSQQGPQQQQRGVDPFEQPGGETLKLSPTPGIVRDAEAESPTILRNQQQEALERDRRMKRAREEEAAQVEQQKRMRGAGQVQPGPGQGPTQQPMQGQQQQQQQQQRVSVGGSPGGGKLRKDGPRTSSISASTTAASTGTGESTDDEGKGGTRTKKGSFMGSLFGRGKKKDKERDRASSIGSSAEGGYEPSVGGAGSVGRGSVDSRPSASVENGMGIGPGPMSPTTGMARENQMNIAQAAMRNNANAAANGGGNGNGGMQQQGQMGPGGPSEHSSSVRKQDQEKMMLYQQYLNRSPSSPPEATQPSYGLQSAPALGRSNHSSSGSGSGSGTGLAVQMPKQRPGSLILTPNSPDGVSAVPELNVIRVFAGSNLQTEATFKTVLLNSSTSAQELVRQAIQRFRLPSAELEGNIGKYYLTAKQVEGGLARAMGGEERPLQVFEELVREAEIEQMQMMRMPRVKRDSVGSISSVASNLSMHPAIKKLPMNDFTDDSAVKFYLNRRGGPDDDDASTYLEGEGDDTIVAQSDGHLHGDGSGSGDMLSVNVDSAGSHGGGGFSSPSFRFPMQLVIYPDDLPDNMVFDPLTEAIIFKDTLRDRSQRGSAQSDMSGMSGVSREMRRKVFVFPKNVTVAEVIELGLERFGILEGVVDGGDEVEDKQSRRRSGMGSRVRYGLNVDINGSEKELPPTSKVIDAYPRPPTYKAVDRKYQEGSKRRSIDSTMLLGSLDDVQPDDPLFVLRKANTYKSSSKRMSAPLDDLALKQLHQNRDSAQAANNSKEEEKEKILAQRRARSENQQRAILSAQANSVRGVDVVLQGNVVIRSSRYDAQDSPRYSVVEPDGEEYDISRIVEEEWRDEQMHGKMDRLQGVVQNKDGMARLDRVLSKIKTGGVTARSASAMTMTTTKSEYFTADDETDVGYPRTRSATPQQARRPSTDVSRSAANTPTPRNVSTGTPVDPRRQASYSSDVSVYATPLNATPITQPASSPFIDDSSPPRLALEEKKPKLFMPKDEFGIPEMMAVIECRAQAAKPKPPRQRGPGLHPVDKMLFGTPVDLDALHPHIRDVYADAFRKFDEFDKVLDEYIMAGH